MEEDEPVPGINFVPCIKWVRRGVAKANPEKVQLTEEELETIINETKSKIKSTVEGDDDSGNEDEGSSEENKTPKLSKKENDDKYNFDAYDDEDDTPDAMLAIGNLAVHASTSNDPYVTLDDEHDVDSEQGDDIISASDNLILVGHVEGDASTLEVYLYNEEEGSLYVHHDILLPSIPLCLEWLNFDPGESAPGNLCAVGSMEPIIEVWDLDVMDSLEPAFKLGQKARKKKGIKGVGHKDAVLDLSWNTHLHHVMASGSADRTVLLWDLESGQPATKLSVFAEKVQTLEFHPFESQTLLTGSCDSVARVFDCRAYNAFKSWQLPGEVERVAWNHFEPFCCLASTSVGTVHYIDCRTDTPLWQLAAHEKEVTGLAMSSQCPGLLMTSGSDGLLKTWDISDVREPVFVSERPLHVGLVQCLAACPDSPFVVSAGGDKKSNNFGVWEVLSNTTAMQHRFGKRELVRPVLVNDEPASETMETALGSMSLDQSQPSTSTAAPPSKGGKKREKRKEKKF